MASKGTTGDNDGGVTVAVAEHRSSIVVGIASLEEGGAPRLRLSQLNDTAAHAQTLAMLLSLLGSNGLGCRVLVSNTSSASPLVAHIRAAFPAAAICTLPRAQFSEAAGAMKLRELASPQSPTALRDLDALFLAVGAAAALLEHVATTRGLCFAPSTLLVETVAAKGRTLIDAATAASLELAVGARSAGTRKGSLFACLSHTITPAGSRLLLNNILQPLCDEPTLLLRQEAVEELLTSEALFFGTGERLKCFAFDLARIATQLCITTAASATSSAKRSSVKRAAQQQLKHIVELQRALAQLPSMTGLLEQSKSSLLRAIRDSLCGCNSDGKCVFAELVAQLEGVLSKDAAVGQMQLSFAVRPGVDPLLDVARKEFTESAEDVARLAAACRAALGEGFPVTLRHTERRGYFLESTAEPPTNIEDTGDDTAIIDVISVTQHKRGGSGSGTAWQFTTRSLASASRRNTAAWERVLELSARAIDNLVVSSMRPCTAALVRAGDALALFDMLYSHAAFALACNSPTVRPEFSRKGPLAIRAGRHPLLLHHATTAVSGSTSVVPNDTLLEAGGVQIVTGVNFSGKSTFIRQVCLLAILAQIGARVPAAFMHGPLFARIVCRSGTAVASSGMGAMLAEACDARCALDSCSDGGGGAALIAIDELGRATAPAEGAAFAWAVAERLLYNCARSASMCLFVTHFADVAHGLAQCYPPLVDGGSGEDRGSVTTRMFAVDSVVAGDGLKVRPLYAVAGGVEDAALGVEVAASAGLPPPLIAIARRLRQQQSSQPQQQDQQQRARIQELGACLYSLRQSTSPSSVELLREVARNALRRFNNK